MIPMLIFALTAHSFDPPWTMQPGIATTPLAITAESTAEHGYQLPPPSRLISVLQSTQY
jgi:hypothetical protein